MSVDIEGTHHLAGASKRRPIARLVSIARGGVRLAIGCLACLTPVSAIVVLGWLQRWMRAVASTRLDTLKARHTTDTAASRPTRQRARWPALIFGEAGDSKSWRFIAALKDNFSEGAAALLSLCIATLPFALLWLFSWWAGWENSFNKGYEQSWVGPTVGLIGVFVALNVLIYVPMALAHQAVERRWRAFFQVRRVLALVDFSGWRYVALAVATAIAGLPIFAAQGLPVFIENIIPGFETFTAEQIAKVAGQFRLLTAIYVFLALVILRWMAARIYAHAVVQAVPRNRTLWANSHAAAMVQGTAVPTQPRKLVRLNRFVRVVLLWIINFGLVAQIFVAQFLNYQWWNWISHPFWLLPWTR